MYTCITTLYYIVFHGSAQRMEIDGGVSFCAAQNDRIFYNVVMEHFLSMSILGPEGFSPPATHHHRISLAILRMVLMTMVGAVLIDHSKLALVGIAYSTILKSWYPAYLRFNVYWNASMRCRAGMQRVRIVRWLEHEGGGLGYDVWRMLKMVEWYEEWLNWLKWVVASYHVHMAISFNVSRCW